MNEDLKKDFIKEVHAAAKSRYSVDVFADMVRAMAIAIEVSTRGGSVVRAGAEDAEKPREAAAGPRQMELF